MTIIARVQGRTGKWVSRQSKSAAAAEVDDFGLGCGVYMARSGKAKTLTLLIHTGHNHDTTKWRSHLDVRVDGNNKRTLVLSYDMWDLLLDGPIAKQMRADADFARKLKQLVFCNLDAAL